MLSDKTAWLRLSLPQDELSQSNLDCTVHFSREEAAVYLLPLLDILRMSGVWLSILVWLIHAYCRFSDLCGRNMDLVYGGDASTTLYISKPPSRSRKQPDGTKAPSIPPSELKSQLSRSKSQSEK